jgi:hypothetical protein
MKMTIDQLAADAVQKYSLCMEMEKQCVINGETPEFQKKLQQTEDEWQMAHSVWEEGLKQFAEETYGVKV